MRAFLKFLTVLLVTAVCAPAFAKVQVHFHSFNGSVLIGRYPHTFIVIDGTLESTGERVDQNFGFSAEKITPAILRGPVKHKIVIERAKQVKRTNRHFTLNVSDIEYYQIIALVESWRKAPGKFYDLDGRNCIHFVGEIAKILRLKVSYPEDMLRRPRRWLNYIGSLNPKINARAIE